MEHNLLSDIYQHMMTVAQFRLRDIIKLMSVSKNLRRISLLEEIWYVITDTEEILYAFIRKIFQSTSNISYPYTKIRRMDRIYLILMGLTVRDCCQ
jgi:hypothetical protein